MDKPKGRTSHDVVAQVRRVLRGVKVGHAGTLDPDATGVLVVCAARATKISAFLMEGRKEYEGVGRLGVTTDSQDATGNVLRELPVTATEEELRALVPEFTGEVEQVPPMFSAVKVDGRRLYRLARKGVEVERASRRVTVHDFEIHGVSLPEFEFFLRCSKGTYVRTLVHDLGERLGCGGHLARLVRSRQGTFGLDRAVSWETLRGPDAAEAIRAASVSPQDALAFLREWRLPPSGQPRRAGEVVAASPELPAGELLRLTDSRGAPQGVGRVTEAAVRILHLLPAGSPFGRGRRAP